MRKIIPTKYEMPSSNPINNQYCQELRYKFFSTPIYLLLHSSSQFSISLHLILCFSLLLLPDFPPINTRFVAFSFSILEKCRNHLILWTVSIPVIDCSPYYSFSSLFIFSLQKTFTCFLSYILLKIFRSETPSNQYVTASLNIVLHIFFQIS